MLSFEFATANRIIFGAGKLKDLGKHIDGSIKHVLFVHGHSSDAISRVKEILTASGTSFTEFQVHGEPAVELVREGVKAAQGCELVIGGGGGSVIDTGKAVAALVTNSGDVFDYLEVVGKGQPLVNTQIGR